MGFASRTHLPIALRMKAMYSWMALTSALIDAWKLNHAVAVAHPRRIPKREQVSRGCDKITQLKSPDYLGFQFLQELRANARNPIEISERSKGLLLPNRNDSLCQSWSHAR
jgi:hypothetical protein